MKIRVDLHVHTIHSGDSSITLREALHWCERKGLDGLAITDHDTVEGVRGRPSGESPVIIPGVEISARGGHILALGVEEEIPKGLSIAETVELIREMGGISVIAHPYAPLKSWVNNDELMDVGLDAVEVANPTQIPYDRMLRRNKVLARRLGLPETGGSDAHAPWVIGLAYTLIDVESIEVDDILKSIRDGRTEARGRGLKPLERLRLLLSQLTSLYAPSDIA